MSHVHNDLSPGGATSSHRRKGLRRLIIRQEGEEGSGRILKMPFVQLLHFMQKETKAQRGRVTNHPGVSWDGRLSVLRSGQS